ncbi:MAG: d(CMP) kinase [Pseudomonadota bacterium]
MSFAVAIDGPAASGKGTIAKAVAAHFDLAHLDTGLLYRAVGRRMLDGQDPVEAARHLVAEDLEHGDLRTPLVAEAASKVAALPDVRAALVDFQRAFARRAGGAVLDGRDIGTVICPGAEAKLYVTASEGARARRRFLELSGRGVDVDETDVLDDLLRRDARDSERLDAPLKAADDAVILDTTDLSIDEAIARAIDVIKVARDARD